PGRKFDSRGMLNAIRFGVEDNIDLFVIVVFAFHYRIYGRIDLLLMSGFLEKYPGYTGTHKVKDHRLLVKGSQRYDTCGEFMLVHVLDDFKTVNHRHSDIHQRNIDLV